MSAGRMFTGLAKGEDSRAAPVVMVRKASCELGPGNHEYQIKTQFEPAGFAAVWVHGQITRYARRCHRTHRQLRRSMPNANLRP